MVHFAAWHLLLQFVQALKQILGQASLALRCQVHL
jgi:hypothetical protein